MRNANSDAGDQDRSRLVRARAALAEAQVHEIRARFGSVVEMDAVMTEGVAHMRKIMLTAPAECLATIPGLAESDIAILDRELRTALNIKVDFRMTGRNTNDGLASRRR